MTGPDPGAGAGLVRRSGLRLGPDPSRVVTQLFLAGEELTRGDSRADPIMERVLAMGDAAAEALLAQTLAGFGGRHHDLPAILLDHFERAGYRRGAGGDLTSGQRMLLGAYATKEYAVEAAALCNPSVVAHPDQRGAPAGGLRVVLSLRAIGEGHISSIEFRTGAVHADGSVCVDPPQGPLATGRVAADDRDAASGYTRTFPSSTTIDQRVIQPHGRAESQGMEDARFVRFADDDGTVTYFATYTAYDGTRIAPQLIATADFATFEVVALEGKAATDKGMALFPRRVHGRFVALSRWDRESIAVATSSDLRRWDPPRPVHRAEQPWELVQVGNCGSPIETPHGWLALTHGVGPMRAYSLGALLLDLDDPSRVLASLPHPLLAADQAEREGYVPNVVYTCGALLHGETLVLPYAYGDRVTTVGTVHLPDLLAALR
ncbi:glycoside hydrolase family 130 protein [Acidiferrimicrobium sp. IK]|uniref:glycoside hydrolase family 130 protein n=1 Tax=Acidiferrimicrobium sp. IK TaxID=2871700 RepID=UPI0021CB7FB1|nr:glycoside hydrolase family 130 protein [Acidiferrimicrobium sp. IK]MCU4182812.1 glycoside hydrolase family 130 protein [Acidiferrimicrobium sp. IK]